MARARYFDTAIDSASLIRSFLCATSPSQNSVGIDHVFGRLLRKRLLAWNAASVESGSHPPSDTFPKHTRPEHRPPPETLGSSPRVTTTPAFAAAQHCRVTTRLRIPIRRANHPQQSGKPHDHT